MGGSDADTTAKEGWVMHIHTPMDIQVYNWDDRSALPRELTGAPAGTDLEAKAEFSDWDTLNDWENSDGETPDDSDSATDLTDTDEAAPLYGLSGWGQTADLSRDWIVANARTQADGQDGKTTRGVHFGFLSSLRACGRPRAQEAENRVEYKVTKDTQRLEMVVNTSRILAMDKEVPRAMVNNPDIVRVVPLSPTKVQLSAMKPGVTQVNLWDEDGTLHTVNLFIIGDAQELQMLLQTEFPQASIRVRPLTTSVVLSGRVDRSDEVSRIVRMAEDYYPKVINNITVGGVQQVMLHVEVMEVSRTKLRALGFDWAHFSGNDYIIQTVSGLIGEAIPGGGSVTGSGGETISFGIVNDNSAFFGFLEALRENALAKVLAEPTLVTVSGRSASFNSGGEFPILVPQSLGTIAIEYKQFGTRVDFVPIVLGNGNIRLEVRPQVSELDNANGVIDQRDAHPGPANPLGRHRG